MNQPLTLSDHLGGVVEAGREPREGGKPEVPNWIPGIFRTADIGVLIAFDFGQAMMFYGVVVQCRANAGLKRKFLPCQQQQQQQHIYVPLRHDVG